MKKNKKQQHPKAAELIRRIRANQNNPKTSIRDILMKLQEEDDFQGQGFDPFDPIEDSVPFHKFKELIHADNAFGLYKEIVATYKDEVNPDKLKEIFGENLTIILERMPDHVARDVSAVLNGIS
jgi:hypothetical protein